MKLSWNKLKNIFNMEDSKPQPPEGEVVMEGEKPDYDKKNMTKGWNPTLGGYQPTESKNNIHPKFKEFWSKNGDRIAELVNVGGWNPTGYGDVIVDEDEYLYDRIGLTEDEFLEHIYFLSKMSGMIDILGNDHLEWFQDQMEIEWERVENQKENSDEEE